MRIAKFLHFLLGALVIFTFPSCHSSDAATSAILKFNLEKGKAYSYAMKIDMKNEVQGRTMNSDMNFDYNIDVLDVKDNIITLKTIYKRVVMKMEGGEMNVDIDTDKPVPDSSRIIDFKTNPMSAMLNMFRAIVGTNFIMKVDAEGKVIEVSGLKEMADAMLNSMNVTEDRKPDILRLFGQQFNEENLKQAFSQAFYLFPNKAIKVGDSWEKTIKMPGAIPASIKTTYKVKNITATKVILDVNADMLMGTNKGTQTGTMEINPKTGLVTNGDLVQKIGNSVSDITITGKEK